MNESPKYVIDYDTFGTDRAEFESLAEAEAHFRACGPEFAAVKFTERLDGKITDESGNVVGEVIE